MNYKKLFHPTLSLIFIIFYMGCVTKKQVELPKKDKEDHLIYPAPMGSETYSLNLLMTKIMENCQAKDLKDQNNSIYIKHHGNYIHIDLNEDNDFRNGSYFLKKESKEKLSCIAPIIKEQNGLFIVITGHAHDNKDKQKNQHLSDNRAISLAELLFNTGIRDEIFAKGCSNNKPTTKERKINIYIYANKTNITNHCK